MDRAQPAASARKSELLEAAYRYALGHGLADLTLRPLAAAIGSSPRVLLFLFGSKDGLIRALLARARVDELDLLDQLRDASDGVPIGLGAAGEQLWRWLSAVEHRPLLMLWVEGYGRSLVSPESAWGAFAADTVTEWLSILASAQPAPERGTREAASQRTLVLAVLRGALMDLLATDDIDRTTTAVRRQLAQLSAAQL